jgi:hypothetical protein
MSEFDDLEGVTQSHLPDQDAEQLFRGTWSGEDANTVHAHIASIFRAARTPAEGDELTSLDTTVSAFKAAAVGAQTIQTNSARNKPMIKKLLTAKAAAAVGAIAFAAAGAAAAAGSLNPFASSGPTIEITDDTTAPTDVTTPATDDTTASTDDTDDTTETGGRTEANEQSEGASEAQGPDVTGPAKFGLCTAFAAQTKHDESTDDTTAPASSVAEEQPIPFQNLEDAATAAGQTVEEFCADATPGGTDHESSPSGTAPGQGDDNPSETAPGQGDDNPSETAPAQGDDNPADTAPGQGDENPGGTAPGQSGGSPSETAPDQAGEHGKTKGDG